MSSLSSPRMTTIERPQALPGHCSESHDCTLGTDQGPPLGRRGTVDPPDFAHVHRNDVVLTSQLAVSQTGTDGLDHAHALLILRSSR